MASRYSNQNSDELNKIAVLLQQQSDDITHSLNTYGNQRAHALKIVQVAQQDYDNEMMLLGGHHMYHMEEDLEAPPPSSGTGVDHNIMRHLNIANPGEEEDFDGAYDDDAYDGADLDRIKSVESSTSLKHHKSVDSDDPDALNYHVELKQAVPGFESKSRLRNSMFSMLDESKLEEMNLELECDKFREDPAQLRSLHRAEDALFEVQKRNAHKLKDMMHEYQPLPFGQAWGNDPDYAKLTRKLKHMLSSPELAPGAAGSLIGAKKTKKKTKKSSAL